MKLNGIKASLLGERAILGERSILGDTRTNLYIKLQERVVDIDDFDIYWKAVRNRADVSAFIHRSMEDEESIVTLIPTIKVLK